jgi:hypothetical protein
LIPISEDAIHVVPMSSAGENTMYSIAYAGSGEFSTDVTTNNGGCGGGSITAIPVFDEGDEKSYAELQTFVSQQMASSSSAPGLESTTYMEIPTVSAAPPNSIPLPVASKSFTLTSGGKMLSFKLETPEDEYVTAVKSLPEPANDEYSLPSTIEQQRSPISAGDDDSTRDSFEDDDEWKPEAEESVTKSGSKRSSAKSKSNRKGNTRPIPNDLPAAERRKLER